MARRAWWLVGLFSVAVAIQTTGAWGQSPSVAAAKTGAADTSKKDDAEYYELYKVFADTMYQVEQNYVKKVNRRELMEAAIRGVLDKLDPYSNYISPEEIARFKTSVDSQFGGIGIQITMDGGQLKVLSPLVGSPAYRAGLQAGDSIVEIAGKSTDKISIDEAVRQLKGEAGTSVTITVVHPRGGKRETLTIDREIIQLDTVMGDMRKPDDSWDFMLDHAKKIGYIRITGFSRDTAQELETALEDLKHEGMKGLVIDLRFNPGGLLKSATAISDLFISDGVIVSTEGRNSPKQTVMAKKPGTFEGFPIAILVNRYSASASEIVSACLQDHHRAVIIGERTWGKGSVQSVVEMEEGKSALKLTTAGYLRPNGHNIHRFPDSKESDEWGVMPDKGYELKLPDGEMGELVRYRRDRDILLVNHHGSKQKPAESDDKKSDDGKSDAEKSSANKKDEAGDDKANTSKTDEKSKDDKSSGEPASEKAAPDKKVDPKSESKPDAKPADKKPAAESKKDAGFVDRQLQKALDYLDTEMARS